MKPTPSHSLLPQSAAEEGEARGRADVARKLKKKGQSAALIAEVTGLSEKEIDDI